MTLPAIIPPPSIFVFYLPILNLKQRKQNLIAPRLSVSARLDFGSTRLNFGSTRLNFSSTRLNLTSARLNLPPRLSDFLLSDRACSATTDKIFAKASPFGSTRLDEPPFLLKGEYSSLAGASLEESGMSPDYHFSSCDNCRQIIWAARWGAPASPSRRAISS